MNVGDLVKVEGGALRPEWYGMLGIITSLNVGHAYTMALGDWYEVTFSDIGPRIIREDMLVMLNENR
jgi:hypothetical protein